MTERMWLGSAETDRRTDKDRDNICKPRSQQTSLASYCPRRNHSFFDTKKNEKTRHLSLFCQVLLVKSDICTSTRSRNLLPFCRRAEVPSLANYDRSQCINLASLDQRKKGDKFDALNWIVEENFMWRNMVF